MTLMITDLVFESEAQPQWCENFFVKFQASEEWAEYQATGDRDEDDDINPWLDRFCYSHNVDACVRRVIFQFPTAAGDTHCYIFAFPTPQSQLQFRLTF